MKKDWKKPQLQILTRSKPEEAVLNACKQEIGGAVGAGFGYGACGTGGCDPCDEWSAS